MLRKMYFGFILILSMMFVVSCSNDDSESLKQLVVVELTSEGSSVDYTTFTVTLKELRSGRVFTEKPDASGKAILSLPFGQYSIVAEDVVDGVSTLYGSVESFTFSETNSIASIEVKNIQSTLEKTFVLNELFFNCSLNGDWDYNYYEEYFSITNVSDRPLYADGLSFAICGDYNAIEDDGIKSAYLAKDSIVVSQLYTIPGNGRTNLVQPGKSLVIAHSAIDHTQGGAKPAAVNLSGANFEIYVPYEYSMTTDNPEVPNLVVNYTMFQAFSWGYSGYAPMMILRANTNLNSYVETHLRKMKVSGAFVDQMQDYLVIPISWIVDGAETASVDNMIHKVLPAKIDKSYLTIQDDGLHGGFKGQFVQRKPLEKGYLQDTNDSEQDFVVVPNGQKSYPKQ